MKLGGYACFYGNCLRIKPFEIPEKAILRGPNGAGKTTILTLLNPLLFELKDWRSLRKALITYSSLKWPLPELIYVEEGLLFARLNPFERLDEERLRFKLKEVIESYSKRLGLNELKEAIETLDKDLPYESEAKGYTFQMNAFIKYKDKLTLVFGNKVLTNFTPSGNVEISYMTPHAPLVRNVLAGALKEGAYEGTCLSGLLKVKEVREEQGEVSPVKVIYEANGKSLELEPWVLGDGEKAMLLFCSLRSELMVLDSPEAFMAPESLNALVDAIKDKKVIIASASMEFEGFQVLKVRREGSTVTVEAR